MCHVLGSWSLQFTPQADVTLNGPWRLGANLALGWVVWTLVPSNQTRSPGLNTWVAVDALDRFMTSAASFNAAVTSDLIWSRGVKSFFYCGDLGGKIDWGNEFWLEAIPDLKG
jgi:hypothetical protein